MIWYIYIYDIIYIYIYRAHLHMHTTLSQSFQQKSSYLAQTYSMWQNQITVTGSRTRSTRRLSHNEEKAIMRRPDFLGMKLKLQHNKNRKDCQKHKFSAMYWFNETKQQASTGIVQKVQQLPVHPHLAQWHDAQVSSAQHLGFRPFLVDQNDVFL